MTWVVLAGVLLAAFYTDIRTMTIPNWLTVGGSLLGLIVNGSMHGWNGLLASGVGLAAGFGAVAGLYALGAVGAGDVKLFAAIGAIAGTAFALTALMYAILSAAVVGIAWLAVRGRLGATIFDVGSSLTTLIRLRKLSAFERWKSDDALRFPFMLAVAPGSAIAFAMTLYS
jgi:prepilin peptidase CpaA